MLTKLCYFRTDWFDVSKETLYQGVASVPFGRLNVGTN